MPISVAILTTDKREFERDYQNSKPSFGAAPEALFQGLASLPDANIHVISCLQEPPVSSPEKLADNIWFHGLVVPKIGWLKTGYQGCIRAVKEKLREIRPDIVHGQGTERDCALSAVFSGFPNVLTIHGNMRKLAKVNKARPFSFPWLAARLEAFALPRSSGIFCNSGHTEDLVRPLAKKTWLVPNAVRDVFFSTPVCAPAPAVPLLLNIGYIDPNKAQNKILAMAARLRQRGAKFQLQFVGRMDETPYSARFRELLDAARPHNYVTYTPEMPAPQLISLMDRASALIHAPGEEAFGLVTAEALTRNLRLFGFNVGGLPDVCAGIDAAVLVEPGNFGVLEEALMQWFASGAPKADNAAQKIRERFHPDVVARRHVEIYREVLSKPA
jgi:glycosyltransferase involved in cell wall biosynthesis